MTGPPHYPDNNPREWTLAEAMDWFRRNVRGWPDGKRALAAIERALPKDTGPHWTPGGPTRDHWGETGP